MGQLLERDKSAGALGKCSSPWTINFTHPGERSQQLCNLKQMAEEGLTIWKILASGVDNMTCPGIKLDPLLILDES